MKRLASLALVSIACCWRVEAAKRPITVHDIYAPTAHLQVPQAIWRPDAQAFAYEEEGKLWIYDISAKRAQAWLKLSDLEPASSHGRPAPKPYEWQNRRVAVAESQWFPDGHRLLVPLTRGVAIVELGKAKANRTITEFVAAEMPALSPDGAKILYRRNNNLFSFDIEKGTSTQLTSDATEARWNGRLDWVYPEELDLKRAAWWSPDSKQIAYLQVDVSHELLYPHADLVPRTAIFEPQRYPQAGTPNAQVRVGIISAGGGATRWLPISTGDDGLIARLEWLPDSLSVAIECLNRLQNKLNLLRAPSDTDQVQSLLSEGSTTWLNLGDDLVFLKKSAQYLWSSEQSGFRHLYLYSLNSGLKKQLTSGNWQVNHVVAVDEKQNCVYFTATEASPLQDQLYSVSLDGGAVKRISMGAGMHSIQMAPDGRHYLDSFSNLDTPPEVALYSSAGERLATVKSTDRKLLDELDLQQAQIVSLTASDGTPLYARLIKPANFDAAKKYPAIVVVYGGPQIQSIHNAWPGVSWEELLADKGFVIWQLDNRGTYGRGHAFETPVYHELGATELADQKRGVEKLLSMGFVDPARIGIYGWSFGGYMTLYSLLHAPEMFKAGIAGAPVTDWHNYDTIYTERYMGLPRDNAEGYRKSSNVLAARNLQGKLMIVCNLEDDNVLFQNTMQMMEALHRAGKQFNLALYSQKTHAVTGDLAEGMLQQMTDFFVENLHP